MGFLQLWMFDLVFKSQCHYICLSRDNYYLIILSTFLFFANNISHLVDQDRISTLINNINNLCHLFLLIQKRIKIIWSFILHLLHFCLEYAFTFNVLFFNFLAHSNQLFILLFQLLYLHVQYLIFFDQLFPFLRKLMEIFFMLNLLKLANAEQRAIATGQVWHHIGKINEEGRTM
jgi:hypothetical protein